MLYNEVSLSNAFLTTEVLVFDPYVTCNID